MATLQIGAPMNAQIIEGYGKAGVRDTITLNSNGTLATTQNQLPEGKQLQTGDIVHILPYVFNNTPLTGTLTFTVRYLEKSVGSKKIKFSSTSTATEILSAFAKNGLAGKVTVVNTGKFRIQSLDPLVRIKVEATGFSKWSETYVYKAESDLEVGSKEFSINPYYETVKGKVFVTGEYENLEYLVYRNLGESTGAELTETRDPVQYYGSGYTPKQTEYASGTTSLSITEQEFKTDNLVYLNGWREEFGNPKTLSGVPAGRSVTFRTNTQSQPVKLLMFATTVKGELLMFYMPRVKTSTVEISFSKEQFRTYGLEFTGMTDKTTNLVYATLISK